MNFYARWGRKSASFCCLIWSLSLWTSFGPGTENTPVSDVYLLEAGLGSIVARFPGGRDIEVRIVGREGMTGDAVVLGGFQSANRRQIAILNRRGLIEEAHGSGLPRRNTGV